MLWHRCRCGAMIPQGMKQCSKCAEGQLHGLSRHMQYNQYRRDKKAAAFYVSAEWRAVRARALRLYDGLDIYAYYEQQRIVTADMVHHIVELEDDWTKRLELTNLLPLSNSSHGIITALYAKDEATKADTQRLLRSLIDRHWEAVGGLEKFLKSLS